MQQREYGTEKVCKREIYGQPREFATERVCYRVYNRERMQQREFATKRVFNKEGV